MGDGRRWLIDVHVLLVSDGNILLTQRRDTNPTFNGLWHLPSGKLDAGESAIDTAAREVEEEVGVLIEPTDLHHVHTIHVNGSGPEPRLGLFFESRRWIGEPTNREPDRCSASVGSRSTIYQTSSSTTPPVASTLTATA